MDGATAVYRSLGEMCTCIIQSYIVMVKADPHQEIGRPLPDYIIMLMFSVDNSRVCVQEERSQFLQFTTGCPCHPSVDMGQWEFIIQRGSEGIYICARVYHYASSEEL